MKVWWCIVRGRRTAPSYCMNEVNPDHDYCKWRDREVSLAEIEQILRINGIIESGVKIEVSQ